MAEDQTHSSAISVASDYSSSQQDTPVSTSKSKSINASSVHLHTVPPAPNLSPKMGVHPPSSQVVNNQGTTFNSSNSVASSNTSPLTSPSRSTKDLKPTVGVFRPHATPTNVTTTKTTTTTSSSNINTASNPKTATVATVRDDSSSSAEAVLLGIESLERQQEELERKRRISIQNTPQRPIERHNPFDDEIASESKRTKDVSSHAAAVKSGTSTYEYAGATTTSTSTSSQQPQPLPPSSLRQRMIPHQPQDHQLESDHHVPRTVQHGGSEVDDEITMESDQPLTLHHPKQQGSLPLHKRSRTGSFGSFASKFFKTPMKPLKRIISDDFRNDPTPQTSVRSPTSTIQPILFGYLHKLGRNGKWQKRWFECDGTSLKYFKSSSRNQILATLDLLRVGTIQLDYSDSNGCTFTIEVAGRSYYLCADAKERARDWVITLNRVKEARMKIGGLRIVQPKFDNATGAGGGAVSGSRARTTKKKLGSQSESMNNSSDSDDDKAAARVVTTGSRPRTKGLGKDDFSEMEKSLEDETIGGAVTLMENGKAPPSPTTAKGSIGSSSPKHFLQNHGMFPHMEIPHVNDAVAVRWRKQRSKVQNVVRRLSRWAKRMTMIRCVIQNNVVHFDPHNQHYGYEAEGEHTGDNDSNTKVSAEGVRYHSDLYNMEKRNRPSSRIEQPSLSGSSSGRISPMAGDDESGIIA